ncbi:hypothetical protein BJX76DRAFT_348802 [Aspergillus varians]
MTEILTFLSVSFLAIAGYNTLELLFWIFDFFKRRQGLYFWSILTATISLGTFMIITTLQTFRKGPSSFTIVGIALVYPCLLISQVLVLYSRMHLITRGLLLQLVLWIIIISSIFLYIPFIVILIGLSTDDMRFLPADRVIERYTIIASIGRELFICGIYFYEAIRQLEPIIAVKGRAGRKVILHLVFVLGVVVVLDALMVLTLYKGESGLGLTYSCVAHSIKLKMEFGILNKLLEMLGAPLRVRGRHPHSLPGLTLTGQDDSLAEMMRISGNRGILTPPGRAGRGSV